MLNQEYSSQNWANLGVVNSIGDGIITIVGLHNVFNGEQIWFFLGTTKVPGLVLNLSRNTVSAVIFDNTNDIQPGVYAVRTQKLLGVAVSEHLLGHVIDPLGRLLDTAEMQNIENTTFRPVEVRAPSIISRTSVRKPLETGLKVIDALVPVGHGQRELIIGDIKTGKTAIALDALLHQRSKGTICIYVAVGQKVSEVARIANILELRDSMKYTIIVSATAAFPAAAQYLAPYSGCSIGEYFMNQGNQVLVIYDDLSKHAVAYRQISLLLRRPPGREGYPGDVFYLHSRLLERAANLLNSGSLTALPIIETIQGDVSAYIPTNVISITDGQIFLETELFAKGIRPAVSPGLSVSRVGSAAQSKTMKKLAGNLKLELAQFREVEDFTKLGFALDDATARLVNRGQKLTRLLVQPRSNTIEIGNQVILLHAATAGFMDTISVDNVSEYEEQLYLFMKNTLFYKVFNTMMVNNYHLPSLSLLMEQFTNTYKYVYNHNT